MTNSQKTLYEILGIPPSASLPEIKTAYILLSRALVSEKLGLKHEEIDLELQIIDLAFNTLSVPEARDAYDTQLAASFTPAVTAQSLKVVSQTHGAAVTSLTIAAAIEKNHKLAAATEGRHETPLKIISSTVDSSVKSLSRIFSIVAKLLVLGGVITLGSMMLHRTTPAGAISKADEKVILQEYYQVHGVRPGSKEEVDLLEIENRRKENEQRAAQLQKEKQDREEARFAEESRRFGDQVSENLRRDEAKARYEEEQKQRQIAEEIRRQDEAAQREEDIRLREERQKLGLPPLP